MRTHLALALAFAVSGCRAMSSPDPAPNVPTPDAPAAVAQAPAQAARPAADPGGVGRGTPLVARPGHDLAIFAAGCFWGVEATFREVPGVIATAVGYTGGNTADPSYEDVCSHTTGHAEAVLVEYDPRIVAYDRLLDVFFESHDPTTRNRQGPDVGDQYRSAIFALTPAQADAAKAAMQRRQPALSQPIVTAISPAAPFWKAEEYHQQYHEKTGTHGCATGKRPADSI